MIYTASGLMFIIGIALGMAIAYTDCYRWACKETRRVRLARRLQND